jgi:hypothetical protein
MVTQDGKLVAQGSKDELLMVEHGFGSIAPKGTNDELQGRVPKGDYTQTQPITIYTEAIERKNFYMSAGTGTNPFARTSGFTQPLNQTRAVAGYDGNVDFEREAKNVAFMRTTGKDLYASNPYVARIVPISNFEQLKFKIIANSKNFPEDLREIF